MIRVLICEDEPPILRRLQDMVERLDPAFTVAATAMNGSEALRIIGENAVDLVLTDIRMPIMNGLELMDHIQQMYPKIMVVVLSGYQDYEYMSHAMRAHSLDYLLKPVSAIDLRVMMERVKVKHMQMSKDRLSRALSAHLNRAAPVHEMNIGYPHGVRNEGQRVTSDSSDNADVSVCLFCAGGLPLLTDIADAEMYPGANVWLEHSLEKLAAEVAPGFTTFNWEFMGDTPVERIYVLQGVCGDIEPYMQCLHEALLSAAKFPISCAFLNTPTQLGQVAKAVRRLRRILGESIFVGRSAFVCVGTDCTTQQTTSDDRETAALLSKCLIESHENSLTAFCSELFERVANESWPQLRITRLMLAVANKMERCGHPEVCERADGYRKALCDAACTALSLKELEQNICSLELAVDLDKCSTGVRRTEFAHAIEQYIQTHYNEHITNQTLAQVFGYVSSYISLLFRQSYQVSPSEYLTQIRMQKARSMMKEHPDMMMREIAESVGFKNQHHFSRIFKKMEGVSPTEYPMRRENEE